MLSSVTLTGQLANNLWTFNWSRAVAGLSTEGNTNGHVTLRIDLLEGGYAAMDNMVITAADTPPVPEPASALLLAAGGLVLAWRARRRPGPTPMRREGPWRSSMAATSIVGRCLCGGVTITVAGAHDSRVGACHCRMCQRWSGGLFLCFTAEASAVTVQGEVARYRSSSFAERAFCPRCGSHLWFNDVQPGGQPASYELMPGLFDQARGWPLRSEIYVDRAMNSIRLAGNHRRKTRAEYEAENPFVEGDLGTNA